MNNLALKVMPELALLSAIIIVVLSVYFAFVSVIKVIEFLSKSTGYNPDDDYANKA